MKDIVIVSAARTAVGRAKRGMLVNVRPDDLAALVLNEVIQRAPGVKKEDVEDVVIGCAFPENTQGLNMGRLALLKAGFPYTTSGQTVNRFCSSGLQAIAIGAQQIMAGMCEVVAAGGAESMSQVPMTGYYFAPNPDLVEEYPEPYMGMGLTAENVAGTVQHHPRGSGPVWPAEQREGPGGHSGRKVPGRDRPGGGQNRLRECRRKEGGKGQKVRRGRRSAKNHPGADGFLETSL